jgi:uncharacterized protein (TIGR02117 family)
MSAGLSQKRKRLRFSRCRNDFPRGDAIPGVHGLFQKTPSGFHSRILIIVFLLSAHSSSGAEIPFHAEAKNATTIFIVHDTWHAAIVIKKADMATVFLPELRDFPSADYLEFSWGDREYFPAPDGGVGLALKAAFWSTGSILHVVGFKDAVEKVYPSADIIGITLSEEGFQRLIKFISDTFSRQHPPAPAEARPGLFSNSKFYAAEGKFSLLRTCNTWVAEALSAAGLPINPGYVITAGNLNKQVRSFAAGE